MDEQEWLEIPKFLRRDKSDEPEKLRKNPFTNCRIHARLSKYVTQCHYKKPPYRTVWIQEFNKAKQIDFLGSKK